MALFTFGKTIEGYNYKVLNEREIRGISGIMLLMGFFAFIQTFILRNYAILPWVSGVMLFHFAVSVLINPDFSPITQLSRLFVGRQTPFYIGAIQKRFAWTMGMLLSLVIFISSLLLYQTADQAYFGPACMLCLLCMLLMFLETAFAICVGCKLYFLSIRLKLMPQPEVKPNCMGDSCEIK